MERFHEMDNAAAILASKGVYKQVKVFRRDKALYAQYGGGFIRLYKGGTSLPNIRLDDLEVGEETVADDFGKLSLK